MRSYWGLILTTGAFCITFLLSIDAWRQTFIILTVVFAVITILLFITILLIVGDIVLDMIDREETP